MRFTAGRLVRQEVDRNRWQPETAGALRPETVQYARKQDFCGAGDSAGDVVAVVLWAPHSQPSISVSGSGFVTGGRSRRAHNMGSAFLMAISILDAIMFMTLLVTSITCHREQSG